MINLIVALSEEARPIIHYYRLKRLHHLHAFPVYAGDNLRLIVCGIGNLATATATGYLAGIVGVEPNTAWLNIGIAGSKNISVGEAVLAHQITDMTRQQHFYPTICFEAALKTAAVQTVSVPETGYSEGIVYDMEAAGFYSAAMRFSTTELIHSLKIISDNKTLDISSISSSSVVTLVEQNLGAISKVIAALQGKVAELNADYNGQEEISLIRSRLSFTVSQQAQLQTLIQNWFALTDASPLSVLDIDSVKTSKALLNKLQLKLNEIPVKY
jgi:hypothetical protein